MTPSSTNQLFVRFHKYPCVSHVRLTNSTVQKHQLFHELSANQSAVLGSLAKKQRLVRPFCKHIIFLRLGTDKGDGEGREPFPGIEQKSGKEITSSRDVLGRSTRASTNTLMA